MWDDNSNDEPWQKNKWTIVRRESDTNDIVTFEKRNEFYVTMNDCQYAILVDANNKIIHTVDENMSETYHFDIFLFYPEAL